MVVDHVRVERPTTSTLFQVRVADEEQVSSLLYALAVTRQFAFKGQKGAPMGGRGAAIPISIAPPAPSEVETVQIPPSATPPQVLDSRTSPTASRAPRRYLRKVAAPGEPPGSAAVEQVPPHRLRPTPSASSKR